LVNEELLGSKTDKKALIQRRHQRKHGGN